MDRWALQMTTSVLPRTEKARFFGLFDNLLLVYFFDKWVTDVLVSIGRNLHNHFLCTGEQPKPTGIHVRVQIFCGMQNREREERGDSGSLQRETSFNDILVDFHHKNIRFLWMNFRASGKYGYHLKFLQLPTNFCGPTAFAGSHEVKRGD
ncbi:MAG: hypothetical protein EOO88_29545 [Pedobacter sp.]|nr:MAG: hypothetical protein EOO88_29545 [Pedobacter sp.]